jgi:hypothetical protein
MHVLFRIGLTVAAMAVAAPALAQSTAFDGTYAGVSGNSASISGAKCPPMQAPASLLIVANGAANSQNGFFQGTVAPDGRVTLHGKEAVSYQGQVDRSGAMKVTGSTTICSFTFTWQKR